MKDISITLLFFAILGFLFTDCANEDMELQYRDGYRGRIVLIGYNAMADSLEITANGEKLEIDDYNAFVSDIMLDHWFAFYDGEAENIAVINKATGDTLHKYSSTFENPVDTISFYSKPNFYIDDVLSFAPGQLNATGQTGYRFIFPTQGFYSNGYDGPLDGIIRKTNGQILGIVENITKTDFSSFAEFAFGPPPIIKMELVKHGTTESYIEGQQVFVTMVMANNKSRLVVLEEVTGDDGSFSEVNGTIDLVDFFEY